MIGKIDFSNVEETKKKLKYAVDQWFIEGVENNCISTKQ
jgi:hypothetical protein